MIVNFDKIPYFTHEGFRYVTCNFLTKAYKFDNDKDYFVIQFIDTDNFKNEFLNKVLDNNLLANVKNGKITLVLNNWSEGYHHIVEDIYKLFVIEYNLPEEQILLFTHSFNILPILDQVVKQYNKKPIKIALVRNFELSTASIEKHDVKTEKINKLGKKFNKKYICLNRRWRPHRPALVATLHCRNLLKHGYVSLADCEEYGWNKKFDDMVSYFDDDDFTNYITSKKDQIYSIPNLYVDTNTQNFNTPTFTPNLFPFYNNTFFSIITETTFFKKTYNSLFLSEKTFNVMTQRHPFLLATVPNSLEALREIGYKTFSPYINESYDAETNDCKRLNMIVDEVERLCNFSDKEVQEFILATEEICEHNFNHLLSDIDVPGRYSRDLN